MHSSAACGAVRSVAEEIQGRCAGHGGSSSLDAYVHGTTKTFLLQDDLEGELLEERFVVDSHPRIEQSAARARPQRVVLPALKRHSSSIPRADSRRSLLATAVVCCSACGCC